MKGAYACTSIGTVNCVQEKDRNDALAAEAGCSFGIHFPRTLHSLRLDRIPFTLIFAFCLAPLRTKAATFSSKMQSTPDQRLLLCSDLLRGEFVLLLLLLLFDESHRCGSISDAAT